VSDVDVPDPDARIREAIADVEAGLEEKAGSADPCFACECCSRWVPALEQLRDSIKAHVAGELRVAPCSPGCLVCAEVGWQG
jgi:hypothetical protein